jgi:glutamine synthetase
MNDTQTMRPETRSENGTQKTRPDIRKISDLFGENIFSMAALKAYVPEETYLKMKGVTLQQKPIEPEMVEQMAEAMIRWAMDKGVTHFCHWFQPLTNAPAEKHDAFFKPTINPEARGIESLTAGELVKRETDGSSFPSGGLRATHSARAYTIWDPSSPAFILETNQGKTLYIPAVFVSFTGESLDYKTPLLKSNHALNKAATAVCQLFDEEVTHVFSTLGWEQEYFLVDERFFNARPDLLLAGRTIFGGKAAKGQQLDDHYFASIPERVEEFMKDFELESLKLGIPILTRHNEVAPGQYECAPMFEETNLAVDHNQLIRVVMEKTAIRHKFRVLFNEKPFAGLNGSGKHCNWSLATSKGKNLLSPGDSPGSNLLFLTIFINVIKAIHDHGDLLRASIASAGNDHRLGANEAPPAIISVYTGSILEQILNDFWTNGLAGEAELKSEELDLGLTKIPRIPKDQTDRNRTSPFPFTDNRFEFRAVGASAHCAAPLTVLNAIVADQLTAFRKEVDQLNAANADTQANVITVLQGYQSAVNRIVFNGNGYSKEWETEAAKRGLSNNKNTPPALKSFLSNEAKELFARQGIFNPKELESRSHVFLENYINKVDIEANLFLEMTQSYILPAAYKTIQRMNDVHNSLKNMGMENQAKNLVEKTVSPIAYLCEKINKDLLGLRKELTEARAIEDPQDKASGFADKVIPYFEKIRTNVDMLEGLVEDEDWHLPKYRELLFLR